MAKTHFETFLAKISKIFKNFNKSRINHFWYVDLWSEPGQYSGKICHFEFGPDLVLRKKSGPTQDLGKINYFEFSPDLVLTFYSGLGQVLTNNSGPSQDPDSGPTQDSGPDLRRSATKYVHQFLFEITLEHSSSNNTFFSEFSNVGTP